MAGRGFAQEVSKLNNRHGRLTLLRNGRWQSMYRPINPDRATSGVCLAESFAAAYSHDHPDIQVGIIPCADGGTSLEQWKKGEALFDNAVNCTRLAKRTSRLVAILWHQGESDCTEECYPLYLERITQLMKELRAELGAEEVPLIVGGLGDFLINCERFPHLKNYPHVNSALQEFAGRAHRCVFVTAEGLTSNSDNLHFSAEGLYEFGLRYYEAFRTIEDTERVFPEKVDMDAAYRTAMEEL
jgi:hypothetical protein